MSVLGVGAPRLRTIEAASFDGADIGIGACEANAALAVFLRGLHDDEPAQLGMVADVLTGHPNLAVGRHIISMRPTP